jgi:hypothetical protein
MEQLRVQEWMTQQNIPSAVSSWFELEEDDFREAALTFSQMILCMYVTGSVESIVMRWPCFWTVPSLLLRLLWVFPITLSSFYPL